MITRDNTYWCKEAAWRGKSRYRYPGPVQALRLSANGVWLRDPEESQRQPGPDSVAVGIPRYIRPDGGKPDGGK